MEELKDSAAAVTEPVSEPMNDIDSIADAIGALSASDGDATPSDDVVSGDDVSGGDGAGDSAPIDRPAYVRPEGVAEDLWNGASDDVRAAFDGMSKAHADALSKETAERQRIQEAAIALREQQAKQTAEALDLMRLVVEAEYSGIDWDAIKAQDPQQYLALQDRFRQRVANIQRIQQENAAKVQEAQAIRQQQAAEACKAELDRVMPRIKAAVGAGFDAKAFHGRLSAYMDSIGIPKEAQSAMSKGYELEAVTKAMLWDEQASARSAAESKLAEAQKVTAPKRSHSERSAYASAREKLKRNPNSTEAVADLLGTF